MALETVKISELPLADDLDGLELIEVVQDGINKQATAADIAGTAEAAFQAALEGSEVMVRRFMTVTRGAGGVAAISQHGTSSQSVGTTDQPALVGNGTLFQATHKVGALSNAAINSGASFYDIGISVFAAASGSSSRNEGVYTSWRGGLSGVRSDQKMFIGWDASTAQILQSSNVPSNEVDCIAIGKDQTDTNIQVMYNNAAGACTKIDTGVAFTALASILIQVDIEIPAGGASFTVTITNLETGVVLYTTTVQSDSNFPTADTLLYWHADVNTGTSTATLVGIYLNRLLVRTQY